MAKEPWNPQRLLQTSGACWDAFALQAGVKLGLFSALSNEGHQVAAVAEQLQVDERALAALLNALAAMGLIEKRDALFFSSDHSSRFLDQGSPEYLGHILLHHHNLAPSWHKLDEAVRAGEPVRQRTSRGSASEREDFLLGMFNLAQLGAAKAVGHIDLAGRESLLDLGGGPGAWAIHFCKANPGLRATVFDLPTTEPVAKAVIKRFAMEERIDFVGGDYMDGEIPGRYEVVWVSHILHSEGPRQCQTVLDHATAALKPGGLLLIHEFVLNDDLASPVRPALFSLNMLVGTERGRSYSESEIKAMLTKAGAKQVRRLGYDGPNGAAVIEGCF